MLRVEEELKENGNGSPEFRLDLGTAFLAIEKISHRLEEIGFNQVSVIDGTIDDVDNQRKRDSFVEGGTINGTINGTIEFPTLLHEVN